MGARLAPNVMSREMHHATCFARGAGWHFCTWSCPQALRLQLVLVMVRKRRPAGAPHGQWRTAVWCCLVVSVSAQWQRCVTRRLF
jgi:hypothetical protein